MAFQSPARRLTTLILILTLSLSLFVGLGLQTASANTDESPRAQTTETPGTTLFLPMAVNYYPWNNPFGVETGYLGPTGSPVESMLAGTQTGYMRLNGRISWRALQPNENDATISWASLEGFEAELKALKALGVTPIITVDDYPAWAVETRADGQPSFCGPIRADKFPAYASFLKQLVARYQAPEFDVHIWELGNEPDVDINAFKINDSVFGCWGKPADPFFGGRHYGEMVKAVSPAIRAADPQAQVWIGGLLLDQPNTPGGNVGKPEMFLKGILEAGAAPYFDVVPFHVYSVFNGQNVDQDNGVTNSAWYALGGSVRGKAHFLRSLMAEYGVSKPLFIDEIGLTCHENAGAACNPPNQTFLDMQANYLVRTYLRGLDAGITGFNWYTLDGPGWRHGALLDKNQEPRPSYTAYAYLTGRLGRAIFDGKANYGAAIEGYSFHKPGQRIHVVWSREHTTTRISLPGAGFVSAARRDGSLHPTTVSGSSILIDVGFEPVYLTYQP